MKKILIIEDNPEVRENTSEILELSGYDVIDSENGKAGVKKAISELPDLIVCDIMMPELDGYGVLHLLSKNPTTSAIPFIFLTAKSEKDDFRKGMSMGADDYITKPFDETDLLTAIENRLKKSEAIKQQFTGELDQVQSLLNVSSSLAELEELSKNQTLKSYTKKEFVYLEGSYPRSIYFVNSGQIKTSKTNSDGKELITGIYKKGEFFGYMPLLNNHEHTDSAVSLEASEIYLIPKDDFFQLIQNNREIAYQFIKMLANNIESKEEELLSIAYSTMRIRVANGLITFFDKHEEIPSEGINISRDDLAHLVGTATETVIRTLSEFKEEGLISSNGRKIIFNNIEGLKKLKF